MMLQRRISRADSRRRWRPGALAALALLSACSQPGSEGAAARREAAAPAAAAAPANFAPERLPGGSSRAWLAGDGDLGDNGYCAARLKLPLDPQPAWEYDYTAAETGPDPCSDLVHFDGRLAGSGGGSVVFLLDAATGRELDRRDLIKRSEAATIVGEQFNTLMFSPRGCLTGFDANGRYYVWAWPQAQLAERSASKPHGPLRTGYVALDEVLVGGNGEVLAAMPQDDLDGEARWREQLAADPRGVVALEDGTVVAWTGGGVVSCTAPDGTGRWRSDEGSRLNRVFLGPAGKRAYISLWNGEIVCRAMADGAELWRFDCHDLVPPEEQRERLAGLNTLLRRSGPSAEQLPRLPLLPQLVSEGPDGLAVAALSGDIAMLDPQTGARRWHKRLSALADRAICFTNGILVHLSYEFPLQRGFYPITIPYLLAPPDWDEITDKPTLQRLALTEDGREIAEGLKGKRTVYGRFVALDPRSGAQLDLLVEETPAGGSIIPARDKVVIAEENNVESQLGTASKAPCRIAAYNWLETGSH